MYTSTGVSILTRLNNRCRCGIPEHFRYPPKSPRAHQQSWPFSLPSPWEPRLCFLPPGNCLSWAFLLSGTSGVWVLSLSIRFPRFSLMGPEPHSFRWLSNIPSIGCATYALPIWPGLFPSSFLHLSD